MQIYSLNKYGIIWEFFPNVRQPKNDKIAIFLATFEGFKSYALENGNNIWCISVSLLRCYQLVGYILTDQHLHISTFPSGFHCKYHWIQSHMTQFEWPPLLGLPKLLLANSICICMQDMLLFQLVFYIILMTNNFKANSITFSK